MSRIRETITSTIAAVLEEKGAAQESINDEQRLMQDLGLDSLDLAVLVVRLEQQLGCDPFRNGRSAVATFGELVAVYQAATGAAS